MLFEIKHWNGKVLHTVETDSLKSAVESLVKQRANLSRADLYGADLTGANLSRANLSRADLYGADLTGANLSGANLSRADLTGANLYGADLSRADLTGANLYGANLYGADLSRANLSRANLSGADLYGARLGDLACLSELSDAIDLASMIFAEWENNGIEAAKERFGLYKIPVEDKALIAMCPRLIGGFCFVLSRREIWWWNWSCPHPDTVPVLWREERPVLEAR